VRDLLLLSPELVLSGVAVALIVFARHVKHARSAAAWVLAAAVVAVYWGFIVPREGPRLGFGGTISADGYSLFFKVLFAANMAVAALLSIRHLDTERVRPAEYCALLLLATTGMMLTASSMEFLMLYLGLELMTLCSYVLVGITRDKATSNEAAMKYFLLGSFASVLLLYGISLTYGVTGATDFATISSALTGGGLGQHPLLRIGVALIVGGLAFKIAAVPFHAWAPDAYQGASAPVAAFLAAGSKAAGLAALGRVCLVAFAPQQEIWSDIIIGLAALSMLVGSLLALAQTDMKRMLAYSSISHAGYALLGLAAGTVDGGTATMTYAFIYAFMTLGAFGVVVGLGERGETIDRYRGLAAQAPGTAAVMFLFLLSLTGIPPTAGFAAKFTVILSVVRSGHVALAVLAVLCSVVSAFFYMRVGVLMFMTDSQEGAPIRVPIAVSAALALAAIVTILGGLFPGTVSVWAARP
jgi:NADH-quinone oxidoreductase subunit N